MVRIPFAAVALLAFSAASMGCADSVEATDYSDENRVAFVAACTDAEGDPRTIRDVCECAYEEISETMTFDEFVELDATLQLDALAPVPDSVAAILADCFLAETDL